MVLCRMFTLSKKHSVDLFPSEIANILDWGQEDKSVSKLNSCDREDVPSLSLQSQSWAGYAGALGQLCPSGYMGQGAE